MQNYTSKNTSVNTTKLPAVYNKVCWDKLPVGTRVIDWGCGKDTTLVDNMLVQHGLDYLGYDPNWKSKDDNNRAIRWLGLAPTFVCSNVLNVIDDDDVIRDICAKASRHKYFFITVYEGDKSGVGKCSKDDCYQRNEKIKSYMKFFENVYVKNGVLTNAPEMIKRG